MQNVEYCKHAFAHSAVSSICYNTVTLNFDILTHLCVRMHLWCKFGENPDSKLLLDLSTPQGWQAELTEATRQLDLGVAEF